MPSWKNEVLAEVRDRARSGYLAAKMGKAASDMETCYHQLIEEKQEAFGNLTTRPSI